MMYLAYVLAMSQMYPAYKKDKIGKECITEKIRVTPIEEKIIRT